MAFDMSAMGLFTLGIGLYTKSIFFFLLDNDVRLTSSLPLAFLVIHNITSFNFFSNIALLKSLSQFAVLKILIYLKRFSIVTSKVDVDPRSFVFYQA